MRVKALKSFAGKVTMSFGEVREIKDKVVLKDLLRAGYVEEIKEDEDKGKKKVKADENQ